MRIARTVVVWSIVVPLMIGVVVPLRAAVVVAPSDETMIRTAPAVVTGTVVDIYVRHDDRGDNETVTRILVDEAIKGDVAAGDIIDIVQFGGRLDGRFQAQSGAPKYDNGARYLAVLDRNGRGQWTTFDLALGQFRFVSPEGQQLLVRDTHDITGWDDSGAPFRDHDRAAADFLAFARAVAKTATQPRVAPDALHPAPFALDFDLRSTSQTAVSTWHGGAAAMNDSVSATPASGDTKNLGDCESRVIADDPHQDIAGTFNGSGVVATAFFGCGSPCGTCASVLFNGETYTAIDQADVVVNDGVSSATISAGSFQSAMTHEIGHTFGFRHSDQNAAGTSACAAPLPCASSAIMHSIIVNGLNGVLQSWDLDAANEVYGDGSRQATFTGSQYVVSFGNPARRPASMSWRISQGSTCTAPSINIQPTGSTISSGGSASMTVVASGTATLAYQWYIGASGNTAQPVAAATAATLNVTNVTQTTSYWCQVTNSCGTANSSSATVTVSGTCTAPSITIQPSGSTISSGGSASMTVAASGTATLAYQWFIGASGVTTQPVGGATSATLSLINVTQTTTYWCRVTNGCGTANSNAATITVTTGCATPSITAQPTGGVITAGSQLVLAVSASNAVSFQWYVGNPPNTSQPVAAGTTSQITVTPNQTTTYWVRVTNSCGPTDSNAAMVTVVPACTPPSITTDAADQTVTSGSSATLTFGYSGTSGIVAWYQGTKPDRTNPIGSARTISTAPLTQTTSFWAEVSNSCGTGQTRTCTVTVTQTCVAPAIVSATPSASSIAPGTSVTLTVVATGSSLQYQWFRGNPQDTSNPLPNSNAAVVIDTPAATTTYWVRVSNGCGRQDSSAIVVTLTSGGGPPPCAPVLINSITAPNAISSNTSVTLTVNASGGSTFHYAWFAGTAGDTNHPVGSDAPSFTSDKLFADASFWVRVTNDCANSMNSTTITITVVPAKHRASRH